MKIALVFLTAGIAAAQTTQGVVVDAVTGAPLAGAYVSVRGQGEAITRTDAAGHFTIEGKPLHVARAGYVPATNVFMPNGGAELTIRLAPAAVIAGKIEDEDGYPVSFARVEVMQYRLNNGVSRLYPVMPGAQVQTDDLGAFRIGGLRPGRYYLRVSNGSAASWDKRYTTQYYGGTAEPKDENRVEVKAGEVRDKIDMRLLKFEGVTVSGKIEGLPQPVRDVMVHVQRDDFAAPASAMVQPDGTFTLSHVTPGKYKAVAEVPVSSRQPGSLRAQTSIEVAATDLTGLVLTLRVVKPVDVAGTVVMPGGAAPIPTAVLARADSGASIRARSEQDGSFVLKGLLPGHYGIQAAPEPPIGPTQADFTRFPVAVSAMLGDQEILRKGFDVDSEPIGALRIALGPPVHVTGKLVDAAGQPAPGKMIFLLSGLDQIGTQTGNTGEFQLFARTPGTYRVYVVEDQSQSSDPDFLKIHEADYPPVAVFAGENAPLLLRAK